MNKDGLLYPSGTASSMWSIPTSTIQFSFKTPKAHYVYMNRTPTLRDTSIYADSPRFNADGPGHRGDSDLDSCPGGCHGGDLGYDFALACGHCTVHHRHRDVRAWDSGYDSA